MTHSRKAEVPEAGDERLEVSTMRLRTAEALIAILLEYHHRELALIRQAVAEALRASLSMSALGGVRLEHRAEIRALLADLYPDSIGDLPRRAAPPPPFPVGWLAKMARTGRRLVDVAPSQAEAERRVRCALQG